MGGNIGKAIASMTIKQSYVGACVCVCVDLLKALLVVLCVLPAPPTSLNLLGRCGERAEL